MNLENIDQGYQEFCRGSTKIDDRNLSFGFGINECLEVKLWIIGF